MKDQYKNTNLNYYIKVRLTEEGKKIYQKHYADFNCNAPSLQSDDEGYVEFQMHLFMNIFGERLFMGAELPCEMNCKVEVEDEWHYVKDGDLPKDEDWKWCVSYRGYYYVAKYEEMFGCWTNQEYSEVMQPYAWKEIILPELPMESE